MNMRNVSIVWYRNFLLFKKEFFLTMFWVTLEPILYLIAFGVGIGKMVDDVNGISYLEYYYPGRLVNTAMIITFYEGTFPVLAKFSNQNTYLSMSFSSLKTNEIALGEITWTCCKGLLAVLSTIIVSSFVGLGAFKILYSLPIIIMHCWIFAALSILISTQSQRSKTFSYASVALILPLSLFTGAFFPLENLPAPMAKFFGALPPAQALHLIRATSHGNFGPELYPNLMLLTFYLVVITAASMVFFRKRLEQ
jgi:lipooligosaccharide transport system permease protein